MSNDYNYNFNGSPGPGPGSTGPRPPRRDWEGISWAIDVALIFAWFPLGLAFTIAHSKGVDIIGKLLEAVFGQRSSATGTAPRAYRAPNARQTASQSWTREGERFKPLRRADAGANVKTVFGWILVGFGLLGAFGAIGSYESLWTVLSMLAISLGGGALVGSAIGGKKKEAKFRRCFAVTGDKGVVDIRKLAKTLGMNLTETDKMITEMVDRGYYGERAYVDHGRRLLVIDVEDMREIYRQEDEEKAQEKKTKAADPMANMTEYERYVELIHQADVDIADEVMSEKIRKMQAITSAIFREVEAHPEKRSEIDRFMNYYLPTTLKLLNSYARIEAQGVSGENMAKAKADIESVADTLVAGYKTQLDKLYRAEAIDIAGDVSVIESMLRRDGLTGESDFGQTAAGGGH